MKSQAGGQWSQPNEAEPTPPRPDSPNERPASPNAVFFLDQLERPNLNNRIEENNGHIIQAGTSSEVCE